MDIVTHAGIGLIAAAPLLGSQPELALGILAGSVLPDLDALSRIFGKRAFLRAHQTLSHSIFAQAAFSASAGFVAKHLGVDGAMLGIGLFAGLMFHTFLDFTNTLGVTLLAPFTFKRFCLESVFFIDAMVLSATLIFGVLSLFELFHANSDPGVIPILYFLILIAYVVAKGIFRWRSGALFPDAISLIPSAICPWRFFGVVNCQGCVQLFRVNAINGRRDLIGKQDVLDDTYLPMLGEIKEFTLMRKLSHAYHVVSAQKTDAGELVYCRDLRTRNFATTFGDLEVLIDPQKRVQLIKFHV